MNNKTILGSLAIAVIAVLAIGSITAFGFGKGFMNPSISEEEKSEMQEQMKAVQIAIENEDYATWKSLMEEQIAKMQAQLTEENFQALVEQHSAMSEVKDLKERLKTAIKNGDSETAEDLRTQLQELMPEKVKAYGLGFERGFRWGFHFAESETELTEE